MDTVTYPDASVVEYLGSYFIPVKLNILESPYWAKEFRAEWTPTFLILDADRLEHYRMVGYLPVGDFLAHLALGRALACFNQGLYSEAAKLFHEAVFLYPTSEVAPQAQYYLGVAYYKGGSLDDLLGSWKKLLNDYPESEWAKKATFAFEK